jgi:thiol-disulfide isomerase/thioredoxin
VKALLTTLVLASAAAVAQQAAPEPTLKAGSAVEIEAVTAAKWVQGEPLTAFEPGKVYMFECWATWCGPCIAAIPHVNELHKKYYDKGLRIYGMNVWEDGLDKVEKFVKGKGDGMSYPIAYTGKGSAFETSWLKAAGVRGIPHAFIVKDGKLVLTSHPSQLTDSVIEALLSGEEGAKKAAAQINAAVEARGKTTKVIQEFRKAAGEKDTAIMTAKIAELEQLDASSPYLGSMKFDLLIAKKDWPAAIKNLEEMPEGPGKQMAVSMTASKVGSFPEGEFPVDFIQAVTKSFSAMVDDEKAPTSPYSMIILSGLQWKSGDKDAATASAESALKLANNQPEGGKMPAAPFEKFVKSVKDGTLPSMQEFSGWLRESSQKQ